MGKVPDDVRLCDECMGEKQHSTQAKTGWHRAQDDPILLQYSTPRWRKLRPRVMQLYPVCVGCGLSDSAVADHEIPARLIVAVCRAERLFPFDKWGGFYILSNLKGRCHGCHNAKSKVEDGQDWTAKLDEVLAPYRRK
jgi:5-methylcytosine-specific restriction endonuclease McrA